MSNSLDPAQAQRSVGPDMDPNCWEGCQQVALVGKELQWLQETKIAFFLVSQAKHTTKSKIYCLLSKKCEELAF